MTAVNRSPFANRSHWAEGFTLIEIMVVIVIIGVLASIATIQLAGKTKDAKRTATEATIQSIRLAASEFEMDNGKFPDSLAQLLQGEKHYLGQEVLPTDGWGNEFNYYIKGDLVKVHSAGPDETFDTEDDIINK